ncbi:fasciclin-like arabinogalactan protein elcF [Parastagonospora nodorum]|nr:fasciclin-like arabinogalactan protein elcF [Parastagonospora nodorum]KAH6044184.1 fasciclin-like arabinogalactan protein elcF [Parastagonospora nodorum]
MKLFTLLLPALTSAHSLSTLLSTHPTLSTLHSLLKQFSLLDDFNTLANITVIAPTNQAYLDLANWGFNVSQIPAPVARALFQYHVLDGEWESESIIGKGKVVHTYLKPPVLTNVTAGAAVKLSSVDGTIMTESGLGVAGGVEDVNLRFDGGVLHTLNASMVLPHNITLTAQINGLGRFLELMNRAGVVAEFEGLKDVTVFVPHDDALEKADVGKMSKEQLASLLRGHVVPNRVLYGEVFGKKGGYKSSNGWEIHVGKTAGGTLTVNGIKVVKEDVILYAGVAHVIDKVLVADRVEHKGDRSYLHLDAQKPLR